jgi:hypothetical protein
MSSVLAIAWSAVGGQCRPARVGHVGIECLGGGEFEQLYFQWAPLGTVATCALQDLAPVVGNKG